MSKLSNYALASQMGRDERIERLRLLIIQKKVRTVDSGAQALNVSRQTILSYLKELNWSLYDPKKKAMTPIDTDREHRIIYPI